MLIYLPRNINVPLTIKKSCALAAVYTLIDTVDWFGFKPCNKIGTGEYVQILLNSINYYCAIFCKNVN